MYKCETIHPQNKHWSYRVLESWIYTRHYFFCPCVLLFSNKKNTTKSLPDWTSQAIHKKHRAGLDVILSQWSLRYRDGKGFDGSLGRRLWKAAGTMGEFVKLPRLIHERVMVVSCHICHLNFLGFLEKLKYVYICTLCCEWFSWTYVPRDFSKFLYMKSITNSIFHVRKKIIGTYLYTGALVIPLTTGLEKWDSMVDGIESAVEEWLMSNYLKPICPLFLVQKKVFSNQNKGHLGSTNYIKINVQPYLKKQLMLPFGDFFCGFRCISLWKSSNLSNDQVEAAGILWWSTMIGNHNYNSRLKMSNSNAMSIRTWGFLVLHETSNRTYFWTQWSLMPEVASRFLQETAGIFKIGIFVNCPWGLICLVRAGNRSKQFQVEVWRNNYTQV